MSRECWTIYRGPGFSAVVLFSSSPTPFPPSSLSNLSLLLCLSVRRRSSLLTGVRGWARKPGPLEIIQYSLAGTLLKISFISARPDTSWRKILIFSRNMAFSLNFFREINVHFHVEGHTRTKSIFCVDCGKKFSCSQGGGIIYHRYAILPTTSLEIFFFEYSL